MRKHTDENQLSYYVIEDSDKEEVVKQIHDYLSSASEVESNIIVALIDPLTEKEVYIDITIEDYI